VPLAHVTAARYVLVLAPTGVDAPKPAPPAPADAAAARKKGDRSAAKPDKKESRAR
jgi:rod shape-determining protein MreC